MVVNRILKKSFFKISLYYHHTDSTPKEDFIKEQSKYEAVKYHCPKKKFGMLMTLLKVID